eukprot:CAMPEP_0118831310 /NCGR_PEP_ID=MMETSP1162-20130426/30243_1 /TAXON_ID=33656 /ORGANISM="Phaeocystis Sp, Strain CCMP2710" /LENGTH=114 /DNA_ID=CAMNT_0006762713 /DNA_START=54 /DNA_END=398 /DNA_ORIENTATION=+
MGVFAGEPPTCPVLETPPFETLTPAMRTFYINEQKRHEIEHARMLKQIAEAAPPIHQEGGMYARQKQEMVTFEEQGRAWRHKRFMPDPLLQAALERVNQLERENPMPIRKMRET